LWSLTLYPRAGEGGGSVVCRRWGLESDRRPDPARSAAEAGRRARAKLRRYGAANVLNRFLTLTYARACFDPYVLRADLAAFFRALRVELGGGRFPYVWVPEWHPGGHGLHAHVTVGQFVPRGAIDRSWGHGFFRIKLIGDLPVGSGARAEARVAAGYLAKYVSKDFAGERIPGLHRYEVGQGFQPQSLIVYGVSADDVIGRASGYMGGPPERVWHSSSVEGWRGPPACWAQWP
jgi:hypothetical protein